MKWGCTVKEKDCALSCYWYVAPVFLVVVALLQQYLAHTDSLSPWKGGGFGMFSTYDSPGARLLKVFVLTGDDEIAVTISGKYTRHKREIRTFPGRSRMKVLALALVQEEWVDYGNISYRFESQEGISSDESPGLKQFSQPGSFLHTDTAKTNEEPVFVPNHENAFPIQKQVRFVTIKGAKRVDLPSPRRLPHTGVRVQLWKINFQADGPVLTTELFDEVVVANPNL